MRSTADSPNITCLSRTRKDTTSLQRMQFRLDISCKSLKAADKYAATQRCAFSIFVYIFFSAYPNKHVSAKRCYFLSRWLSGFLQSRKNVVRSEVKQCRESSFQKRVACLRPRKHTKLVCAARCQANYVLLESHWSVVPTQSDVMMCVSVRGSGPNMGGGIAIVWYLIGLWGNSS